MNCDQCQMLSINGIPCHETGCPNAKKTWKYGAWILILPCSECGEPIEVGTACGCCEPEEDILDTDDTDGGQS